ncbi:MAG: DUF4393 domain-containing protein [Defluviitaleaceae bacterium]|nr:DUF4393 domain-containing protein [Defluviitaleaceae bacterium]
MSDEDKNNWRDALAEVAKEVYVDVGKPILKPTGELTGLIPRTIRNALSPLIKWNLKKEYNLAETEKLLAIKLQNVDPSQIRTPEAYIAVPAIQYISYCMDSEGLRDMYAELLAKSMNEATYKDVHPSFVEIIKQLCPDEAKILNIINTDMETIDVILESANRGSIYAYRDFSDIGYKAKCEYPGDISKYINNMGRLGIISKGTFSSLFDKTAYDPLKNHPLVSDLKEKYEGRPLRQFGGDSAIVQIEERIWNITSFGKGFINICINPIIQTNDSE